MTKLMPLTRGKFAIVDDNDFEWLNQWKWNAHNRMGKFYAARAGYKKLGYKKYKEFTISMHREILNAPKKAEGDHIIKSTSRLTSSDYVEIWEEDLENANHNTELPSYILAVLSETIKDTKVIRKTMKRLYEVIGA